MFTILYGCTASLCGHHTLHSSETVWAITPHITSDCAGSEKGVVPGVEQAIGTMKLKESAQVNVKSQYAYGDEGCKELGIPGGAELVYDIRLNNFTKVGG